MSRRTVTIDPALDQIINLVRGLLLMMGQEYNYTEAVNGAIWYGICYWLNIPRPKATEIASQVLTSNLKTEGIIDELKDKVFSDVLSKLQIMTDNVVYKIQL